MYWKMSIDLSYPLVTSMGQHDALDGFITYNQLQQKVGEDPRKHIPDLSAEIADMAKICRNRSWATDDPLGIGGLLCDAWELAYLVGNQCVEQTDLLVDILDSSLLGLESYARSSSLTYPADNRLAFRELGLSIGLRAIEKLQKLIAGKLPFSDRKRRLHSRIEMLMHFYYLAEMIEAFWLDNQNRETRGWIEHRDINMVMLASSLAPDGYLGL
jgi:hypothetical protein